MNMTLDYQQTKEELQKIVQNWNQTKLDYPFEKTIHLLFEEQAEKTPKNIALIFKDEVITYQELNQKANQLAHYIKKYYREINQHDLEPDTLIGIFLERSISMLVGILAILKAGGAYVPIDPKYPHERIQYILRDTKTLLVLSQKGLLDQLPQAKSQVGNYAIICVDDASLLIDQQPSFNPPQIINSHHLAYVIYTSGSTGKPKGVLIEHRSVVNCIFSISSKIKISSHERFLAVTAITFDVSVLDYFMPLSIGAQVVIADHETRQDAKELIKLIKNREISAMQATPALWDMLTSCGWQGAEYFKILTAGEALSLRLARNLLKCGLLFNIYGPTEITIYATLTQIQTLDLITIGKPLDNVQAYILDESMQLVPIGMIGDLYIGGIGLARGYLNQPEVTHEKFIDNIFLTAEDRINKSLKLYKTGDLARWLIDGQIEYIGRSDFQVKIRGFRIELGEIEESLSKHPAIKQCVVIAYETLESDGTTDKQLIAYYIVKNKINSLQLREYLKKFLPDYMLPARFIELDNLPLTVNGKIDRQALLARGINEFNPSGVYTAPCNEIEKKVKAIWQAVLDIEPISVEEDFFVLGGHSLSAFQIIMKVNETFNVYCPIKYFFANPTIRGISKFIENSLENKFAYEIIKKTSRRKYLPLSFSQQRLWFLDQYQIQNNQNYSIPIALRLTGRIDISGMNHAINTLCTRHEILRTLFRVDKKGNPYQFILRAADVKINLECKMLAESKLDSSIAKEAQQPFNLSAELPIRIKLYQLNHENDYVLFINQHHIICDDWSMGILLTELSTLYNFYLAGNKKSLPPLDIQYADFAAWERSSLNDEKLKDSLIYWQNKLQGFKTLQLPTDKPRPLFQTYNGAHVKFIYEDPLLQKLKDLGKGDGCTLFMVLLTGFYILLNKYSHQSDIVIGTPVAGRSHPQLENLIGCFVNTLVLRLNIKNNIFSEILKEVKEVCLESYQHQDLPFERLVEKLNIDRDQSRTPIFQVMFVLQNSIKSKAMYLTDIHSSPINISQNSSKFDLTIYVEELESGLVIDLEYNTDLYQENTLVQMLQYYRYILTSMVDNIAENINEVLKTPALMHHEDAIATCNSGNFTQNEIYQNKDEINKLRKIVLAAWQKVLGKKNISINDNFFDVGGHSLKMMRLKIELENSLEIETISMMDLFKYPTVNSFVNNLFNNIIKTSNILPLKEDNLTNQDIAIIALSGEFPGSTSVESYWTNILAGNECIDFLSLEECRTLKVEESILNHPNYIPAGGRLQHIEQFDPIFWRMSLQDASLMDPQIRKFLEHCWIALEKAGYVTHRHELNIGVFAGSTKNEYLYHHIANNNQLRAEINMWEANTMNDGGFLATRVSYLMGLRGPAVNISTGCSTSLVSVIEACEKLSAYNCDLALAGGVSIVLPIHHGYVYQEGMVFSKDGHCRPFDARSNGTLSGSGVGAVVLKRLEDAEKDGDQIVAVIKGYAINNDGNRKVGYTAPSASGQAECILMAQKRAKVSADTIDYIECHGTGTALGDQIEFQALKDAFKANIPDGKTTSCALGSVKANIGHLDVAAGIAGVIKVCKMLEQKKIPPQINFTATHPDLSLSDSPFRIETRESFWGSNNYPRRAGVSSFGIGGTNAHIILEEYQEKSVARKLISQYHVLPISAETRNSLSRYKEMLIEYLTKNTDVQLADIAYSLQEKREYFNYRYVVVCASIPEAIEKLKKLNEPSFLFESYKDHWDENVPSLNYTLTQKDCEIFGEFWLKGRVFDWNILHKNKQLKYLSLPSYQFDNQTCWIEKESPTGQEFSLNTSESNWYYQPVWKWCKRSDKTNISLFDTKNTWLVFDNTSNFSEKVKTILEKNNQKIIYVKIDCQIDSCAFIDDHQININPFIETAYHELANILLTNNIHPDYILYFWSCQKDPSLVSADELNSYQYYGYYSLFLLQKEFISKSNKALHLISFSLNMFKVIGNEKINYQLSPLLGPVKIIPIENSNVKTLHIDLYDQDESIDLALLLAQLENYDFGQFGVYSMRNKHLWEQDYRPVNLPSLTTIPFTEKGIYLITGGLGGMGLAFARYIASKCEATFILTGRRSFPEKDEWYKNNNNWNENFDTLTKIKEIEKSGSHVFTYQCDVSNLQQIQNLFDYIFKKFNKLDGIIHAAGIAAQHIQYEKTISSSFEVLNPKVFGTFNLIQGSQHFDIAFLMLCSSLTSVTGALGNIEYCAANAYLDVVSQVSTFAHIKKILAINWNQISDVGMAIDFISVSGGKINADSIPSIKAGEILSRSVNGDLHQLIITKVNTFEGMSKKIIKEKLQHNDIFNKPCPLTETDASKIEVELAYIFSEILGVREFSKYKSFFELGGHSLNASQLITRINKKYAINCQIQTIFKEKTVTSIANYVAENIGAQENFSNTIERIDRSKTLQLSFTQRRLWFLDQYQSEESQNYNIPFGFMLSQNFNITAFTAAMNDLVARHEILRTIFTQDDSGQPRQIILSATSQKIDLTPVAIDWKDVKATLAFEALRPFNLGKEPSLRIILYQIKNAQEYVLFINQHHIISDGWSIGIFFKELSILYNAYVMNQSNPLPMLEIQYADYAAWQIENADNDNFNKQLVYWKNKLQGVETLQLPCDKIRPATQTYKGSVVEFSYASSLIPQLKELAGTSDCTLYMVLLTGFYILLHRYSGQTDIVVGTPIANRSHPQLENLLGFFANTLALRNQVKNVTVKELLLQIKEMCLEAYQHQDLPFERIVSALNLERDQSHSPIFQILFVLQNISEVQELNLKNVDVSLIKFDHEISKFDLTIYLYETLEGLQVNFEYNTDLYNEDTIIRMQQHYENILLAMVDYPDLLISELPMLSASEYQKIVVDWNLTQADFPKNYTLHQLFEQQVKKTPQQVALIYKDQELTYLTLNEKANQLASFLKKEHQTLFQKKLTSDTLIALCVERCLDMVVGMLAILKAGGAYVPINPNYPQERVNYILKDIQADLLLTQQSLVNKMPFLSSGNEEWITLCIDNMANLEKIPSAYEENVNASPHQLAYVIYTSGSTGKPKGVMIEHLSLVNVLYSLKQKSDLTSSDRILALTPFTFDISGLEIFLPLLIGACCILASEEMTLDGELLKNYIEEQQVSFMQATPATWQILQYQHWQPKKGLKIFCGGETLNQSLAHYLSLNARVWNVYGPTETTIWSTTYLFEPNKTNEEAVSIGRPIANTQIYILDHYLKPVPVGVIGELYIGGEGLARGYWNLPELTRDRFISINFNQHQQIKLYRTGDLARYLPDGNIEHIGRVDSQVKIKGFRIELGEIETVLNEHPAIRQSSVIVYEESGQKKLIAYYVAEPTCSDKTIRQHLKKYLPDYMVPALFIRLESLPLTANGKIDKNSLPSPTLSISRSTNINAQPKSQQEIILAQIWREILKIETFSIDDNFFSLGGDSIMSIQVVTKAQAVGIYITPKDLFSYPTIRELAKHSQEKKFLKKEPSSHGPLIDQETIDQLLANEHV